MNTLYFRGKEYPTSGTPFPGVTECFIGSQLPHPLSREDLQALALMKYSGRIVRNHPDTLSPRVRSFLEAIALPTDFIEKHAALELQRLSSKRQTRAYDDIPYDMQVRALTSWGYIKKGRRIPHVKLVKASSLLPGMSIARWLMADDEQPGRRHGRILEIRTVTLLGGQTYLQCSYKNNPMDFNSPAVPYSLWLAPQQLVPVLAGWRNKADV